MIVRRLLFTAVCGTGLIWSAALTADDRVDYLTQIKPVLRERCFVCHGPLKQEAGLRLDTVDLMIEGGDSGSVVTRNDASSSILLERVSAVDPVDRMPPEEEGEPLSAEQIALLRAWIAAGAPAPSDEKPEANAEDHWAFRPIVRPAVPVVNNQQWVRTPVDAFLAQQHQLQGLVPQAGAPRSILVRRLYFDLLGLPPTVEDVKALDNDQSPGWYGRLVQRLLKDPRHGERWARHWMDIWRYSDWWGLDNQLRNSQKHIWHWRDWIVESLNEDTPYDEMVRMMLAADELYPNDLNALRATGYLARNYFLFNRNQWMNEVVEHVSKGFLGLTVNCAKCHDHKYDPIEQVDFYRMRAFFEPYHVRLDIVAGESDLTRDAIPRAYDGSLDSPTYLFIRGQEKNPDKSTVISPGVPKLLAFKELKVEPVELSVEAWQPERRPWVLEAHLATARNKVESAEAELQKANEKLNIAEQKDVDGATRARDENRSGEKPPISESPRDAVADARAELAVTELSVAVSRAELESVRRTAAAMRFSWTAAGDETEREETAAAVRAEREMELAKARYTLANAELLLSRAADKNEAAEKDVKDARETLKNVEEKARAPVAPDDSYTRLAGAKWSATRFLHSGVDDPIVEFTAQSTGRRTALADWITDPRNPLTARVAVNHIWTRHMGAPLVPTVFDFGRNGARPVLAELLDWMASELVDNGWSMKHLHRVIVNSAAYRLSSSVSGGDANHAIDPENRYLWRRTPIRIESQAVRDSILAHAGMLDPTMGGPPVQEAEQDASKRRSLYFFHSNNQRNLFLTTFDEAMVKECYQREQSIVPQQALALTNSKLVLDASGQIALRLSEMAVDESSFIRKAFIVLLGIDASEAEIAVSHKALESWQQLPEQSVENARAHFVWALVNHNDFVTLR